VLGKISSRVVDDEKHGAQIVQSHFSIHGDDKSEGLNNSERHITRTLEKSHQDVFSLRCSKENCGIFFSVGSDRLHVVATIDQGRRICPQV
jgi:hypothetical protein